MFLRALEWKMLVYLIAIWKNLRTFGSFSPVLVCCTKKNMSTLQANCYVEQSLLEQILPSPRSYFMLVWNFVFKVSPIPILKKRIVVARFYVVHSI
jgi:hypothetical protein